MIYINDQDIQKMGINWNELVDAVEESSFVVKSGDSVCPIKQYLRFRDKRNRIISMPGYLGGDYSIAGLKWIASFPENILKNKSRASCVTILNDSDTGEIIAIFNGTLLSILRTVAVSGLMMRYYDMSRNPGKIDLGIIGWGPIGQYHYRIFSSLYNRRLSSINLYDIRKLTYHEAKEDIHLLRVRESWKEVYENSNIFITCTTVAEPYIVGRPHQESLHLNVSLRDYAADVIDYFRGGVIVDEWEEVCREGTTIERFHKGCGLDKQETINIFDVVCENALSRCKSTPIIFNPMGMSIFDLAIAKLYMDKATRGNFGKHF